MTDLAIIGFRAETGDLDRANQKLSNLANTGGKTEKKIKSSTKSINNEFLSLNKNIGLVSASLAGLVTAAAVASVFTNAAQAGREFEKSVSSLSAITGATGKDLEFYKQQAAEIGRTTTLSASQAVEAFKLIASAKPDLLESADALAAVTKNAVVLAEASGGTLTLAQSAEALGKVLNQFNLDASKSTDVINLLAEASRAGTAGVASVSESLKNVGSTANSMGVSLTETVAGIEALAKSGIDGAEAGTALRQVLSKLEKTGIKTLQPSVVGLTTAVENLSKKNLTSLQLINMFGEEAQTAAASILAQKDTLGQLSKSLDGTNTAFIQASTNVDNLDGDLKSLWSVVEGLQIGFSGSLDPSMRSATQSLTEMLAATDSLVSGIKAGGVVVGTYATLISGKMIVAQVQSAAASIAALKATAAQTTGIVAQISAEKSLLIIQQQSLVSQLASAQSDKTRSALRSALAVNTQALTNSESRLTAATLASTVATRSATVSVTALGMATRFLMGPWGLLITTLGAAAAAFSYSQSKTQDQTEAMRDQNSIVTQLEKNISALNQSQLADAAVQIQFKLLDVQKQRIAAEREMQTLMFDSGAPAGLNIKAAANLNRLNEEYERLSKTLDKIYASGKGDSLTGNDSGGGTNDKYEKQIAALRQMQKEVGMTNDQLFIFRERQKSIANGDTPAATAEIVAQAKAVVALKKAEDDRNSMFGTDTVDLYALNQSKMYDDWIKKIEKATGVEEQLRAEIEKTKKAMADNHLSSSAGNEYIKQLEDQIKSLNSQKITVFDQIGDSTKDALGSIQDLYAQGSKEYQKLGIAIQAVSAAQAVYAVLNQASGEPYSAPARMAAMASMVASLGAFGVSLASIGGGFTDDSAAAQANQGLTVWGDKSESIANAIELTQDATSKLVGINTNMLSALQSMAQNLSKASALIVRDSGGASFSGVNVQENFWDNFGFLNKFAQTWNKTMSFLKFDFLNIGGFIFDTIGKWLGGSSKVTDSGIKIIGGSINDMIDNMTVQAFQDVKYKKWRFGGTKRKTQIQDISDAVGGQFSLVLESMLDSVVYGAQALGISDSAIQSRVNSFEIAMQEISLKGLSADEQQAEIEAVFSKIFDDLAIAVVPFAVDFQKVGEGLGETMSRLAIQMQVAQAASDQLGFSFGNASAEMNAFVSNELSAMVGGVSDLASLTSSFVDNFASDEKKLEINTNALNQAMSGVGLGIPATAEGFFDLMGTLDATTEAGRAQIATMLQIQDVAGDYYDLLEDAENDRLAAIQATDSEFNSLTKNLRNMIISMYNLGDAAETVTLDMALAAAKQGNFELAKQFGGVDIQQSDYGSFAEYALAQAVAANKIDELANLTEDQVSVDERQLNVLEEINKNIISSYNPSALTSDNNTQVNAVAKQQQQDIEQMKYAQQTMAKNAAQTAKILQRIEGGGIDVRVIG